MLKPQYTIRPDERIVCGLVYLGGLVPIWGILIAWTVREAWREKSRHVVYHTTQLIWFQVALLIAFIIFAVIHLTCRILLDMEGAGQAVGAPYEPGAFLGAVHLLDVVNDWVMAGLGGGYVIISLVLAWLVMDGRRPSLPLIGPRVESDVFRG